MADTEQAATKTPELKPYAVAMPVAQSLMGDKSRSEVYEAAARGEVDFVKDGKKTLVVLASIERRQAPRVKSRVRPSVPPGATTI